MKKFYILLAAILTINIANVTNAQTMVDTNKVWSIIQSDDWGVYYTYFCAFKNDTLNPNFNYKGLYYTFDSTMTTWTYTNMMLREDTSKKVYVGGGVNDLLLYDFNVNINDTVTTLGIGNGEAFKMIVDSINTITLLDGELRKRIFLHVLDDACTDVWIDGIGSIYGVYGISNVCGQDAMFELNCLIENNTLKYHNAIYPSCYYNNVGIKGK